ncbi:hypothetical protein BX616_005211 [Lobosporangium transversale]|nr:hypothetical protein BX616_005211 [Lobosporangium transversale]
MSDMDKSDVSDSEDDFNMDDAQNASNSETLETIARLKKSLEENPNQYEQHIQLIALLKSTDMLEEIRRAREHMSAAFPLSEELWISWIEDESNMAASRDEKEHVLELYDRATADYLCNDLIIHAIHPMEISAAANFTLIWKSFLDYVIQEYMESIEFPENDGVVSKEYLTDLFKKAKKFTGHHVAQSHVVWNTWMEFELQQLASQDSPSLEEIKRLKLSYLDRIAIPHADLENTFSSLSSFITKYDGQVYEESMIESNRIVGFTRKVLAKLEPFEEQLKSSGNDVGVYTSYLEYELKHNKNHFSRIRTLFERAIAVHCLVPSIWNEYLGFLLSSNHSKKEYDLDPTEMLSVATRSTRNCPWSGDLWENRFIMMSIEGTTDKFNLSVPMQETYLRPDEELNDVLASALSDLNLLSNPQELSKVLLARCSYKYRRANKDEAGGDPYCKLERLWIELESTSLGDHEKARRLWKSIEGKQKSFSDFWIAQADMERALQNDKGARQIFNRACQVSETLDWPEKVFEAWLLFERRSGTLQNYKDALIRIRHAMKAIEALRAQSGLQTDANYSAQAAYEPTTAVTTIDVDNDQTKNPSKDKKRKHSIQNDNESPAAKITKTDNENIAEKNKPAKPLDISAGRHEDTCFVTNFPANMTEKRLKELFEGYGEVLRCTIPRAGSEGKRQFAYVQFTTADEAHAALALDGRDVGDRRGLSVKISDTSQKKPRGTGKPPLPFVSRHELHISGISNELKEEDLRKLVALYAEPTSVFIKRGGATSGGSWANIKFSSEELVAARRLFTKAESSRRTDSTTETSEQQENDISSTTHLSRRQRRTLARGKAKEAEGKEDGKKEDERAVASATTQNSGVADVSSTPNVVDGQNEPNKSLSFNTTTKENDKRSNFKTPLMQPRSMQPRIKRPVSHTRPPIRAFKPAAITTATTTSSVGIGPSIASSVTGAEHKDGGGETKDGTSNTLPVPKSNAEFRELMLSGALKKRAA